MTDNSAKRVFLLLAAMFLLALALHIVPLPSATAQSQASEIGRYQLSSWASYAGSQTHHSGYYVLDTVTGKIIDKGHEIHGISSTHPGK